MKAFTRWLIRWTLIVFAVGIAWGFAETLILGPKGPKVPHKTSVIQALGD
jgi:hypothetical protein